jgi:hypothetical protein
MKNELHSFHASTDSIRICYRPNHYLGATGAENIGLEAGFVIQGRHRVPLVQQPVYQSGAGEPGSSCD